MHTLLGLQLFQKARTLLGYRKTSFLFPGYKEHAPSFPKAHRSTRSAFCIHLLTACHLPLLKRKHVRHTGNVVFYGFLQGSAVFLLQRKNLVGRAC